MEPAVLSHIENRIGFITLNRPDKRNAMSPEMIEGLGKILDDFEANSEVKVVILRAEGKAFCAGMDLAYLQEMQDYSFEQNLADSARLKGLFSRLYEFSKVVIAEVQGHALAGGFGLVTVCDFAISCPEAKFGYTEAKIGFVPALVSVFLTEQIGFRKAGELLLSANLISADKAAELGLLTAVVPAEELSAKAVEFAEQLVAENSAFSMQETKRLLRSLGAGSRHIALNQAAEANAKARNHPECVKGVSAFLSKTKPSW
jgi:methylglutaconyl-CoA hydratase